MLVNQTGEWCTEWRVTGHGRMPKCNITARALAARRGVEVVEQKEAMSQHASRSFSLCAQSSRQGFSSKAGQSTMPKFDHQHPCLQMIRPQCDTLAVMTPSMLAAAAHLQSMLGYRHLYNQALLPYLSATWCLSWSHIALASPSNICVLGL